MGSPHRLKVHLTIGRTVNYLVISAETRSSITYISVGSRRVKERSAEAARTGLRRRDAKAQDRTGREVCASKSWLAINGDKEEIVPE